MTGSRDSSEYGFSGEKCQNPRLSGYYCEDAVGSRVLTQGVSDNLTIVYLQPTI